MSTTTVWEPGLNCAADDCGGEFTIGEDAIYWYGRLVHQRCAARDAAARRLAADECGDVMVAARGFLDSGSRVILTRRQLHDLVTLATAAGVEPVRKPDAGRGRLQWYSRMHGWAAERVQAGLSAAEAAGLWLDFLEVGRMPPLRSRDLRALVEAIQGAEAAALSRPSRDRPPFLIRDRAAEGTGTPRRRTPMNERSSLVQAIAAAHAADDGAALAQAVAALDSHDAAVRDREDALREVDLGAHLAAERLTPVPLHELHTAATSWLADFELPADDSYRTAMIAEASLWYRGLDHAVKADGEELAEQARGRARTAASAYGPQSLAAAQEFLSTVGYLRSTDAASGLPQIDQVTDPNNQPGPTPYPTEVFDNFAPEQDPFNGTETNAHGSGAASTQAPLLQQVQQQGGGSGYGSGPERQLTHDEGFDTSNSYAEVPLGTPGQIPTAPAATDSQAGSAPTPLMGQPQDTGAEHRQTVASVEGYSMPDPFGYRWLMTTDVMHPFHERCGSAHWPDESCGDRQHTASVAIGYTLNLDQARRRNECETVGVKEGLRAVTAAQSLQELGAHHNRIAQGWNASGRAEDDTAVLHGFMAVVRPVLAELAAGAGQDSQKTAAKGLAGGGGVTKGEREHAKHHLPGTSKFPVSSAADVENAKHDVGRTSEPKSKVTDYLDSMAQEYHVAPVGGGKDKKKSGHSKAASRLDFH